MTRFSPVQQVVMVILLATSVRVILAAAIGLGVDESYVVAAARSLSLSYFDHPPLHFWLVWLTVHLTGSENPLILRLPFIALFAGTTWLMFRLTQYLFGDRAGVYAALALNLSAVFSLSSGSWILPDGPLLFFLLAAALPLAKLTFDESPRSGTEWGWVGLWLGLGLLSKYHALFLVFGVFIYLLTTPSRRRMATTAGPYLAALIAGLLFLPVLIWNHDHGWVSFVFQGSRGAASGFHPEHLAANIAGQAVWILPWIWLPLIWLFIKVPLADLDKTETEPRQERRRFLWFLAAGPIVLFSLVTLWGGQGLFHWQAPGYLFLFPLLGEAAAAASSSGSRLVGWWLRGSALTFLLLLVLLGSQTATGWMADSFPKLFPSGDPTLEALDWRDIAPQLAERGLLDSRAGFVVSSHWIDAGKIDYALGGRLPVLCLNDAPHHFAFRFSPAAFRDQDALIIGRKQVVGDGTAYAPYFAAITPLGTLPVQRQDRTEFELVLFYASKFKGNYPLPYGL